MPRTALAADRRDPAPVLSAVAPGDIAVHAEGLEKLRAAVARAALALRQSAPTLHKERALERVTRLAIKCAEMGQDGAEVSRVPARRVHALIADLQAVRTEMRAMRIRADVRLRVFTALGQAEAVASRWVQTEMFP